MIFGTYTRRLRQQRQSVNERYSIRRTAERIGVEPTYLGRIERGEAPPPSEETIQRIAADLGEDADLLLALAGKVASDIRQVIVARPVLFAELIRGLSDVSDDKLITLVHGVRNGEWHERGMSRQRDWGAA
ncbi:MAG: helix-turn-helix domain-containing protein [Candidatus Contendobacter sp.]|nr:helix-turn-helix domain-containing protein [Candidatus Contendobacter sp.]MDG4558563.1 helix-turn-helix domain-containing protein [Candidatus Contendobacter sp.]